MQRGGDDEHKEELPVNIVQGDRPRHQDDDIGQVESTHAHGHTLGTNVRWKDLGYVEELGGVDEGRPERGDEEEDEEDGGILARSIVGAQKRGL